MCTMTQTSRTSLSTIATRWRIVVESRFTQNQIQMQCSRNYIEEVLFWHRASHLQNTQQDILSFLHLHLDVAHAWQPHSVSIFSGTGWRNFVGSKVPLSSSCQPKCCGSGMTGGWSRITRQVRILQKALSIWPLTALDVGARHDMGTCRLNSRNLSSSNDVALVLGFHTFRR